MKPRSAGHLYVDAVEKPLFSPIIGTKKTAWIFPRRF
jgi:hypothetical protein